MPSLAASGTLTPSVIGTEYTLLDSSSFATFVSYVDTTNMTAADSITLRVYSRVLGSGGLNLVNSQVLSGVQNPPVVISMPYPSDQEILFSLQQTAGVARAFPWKVIALP